LAAILAEVRRLLAPTGLCSFAVDYHDHYAGADSSIDGLNFLRFDDREWRRWNCGLQFQNRLRHGDYVELFEAAGFDLVKVDAVEDPALPDVPVLAPRLRPQPLTGSSGPRCAGRARRSAGAGRRTRTGASPARPARPRRTHTCPGPSRSGRAGRGGAWRRTAASR